MQIGHAQSLPIDFEMDIQTSDFVDFDGGIGTVIDNPQVSGINTSDKVAQIVRDGGAIWSGSKIILDANLNFTTMNGISMKVYSTAPIGTVVKFKLEGTGTIERDVVTTVANEWETLTWDFTGAPSDFNELVFMFDFGNVGNGSASSTFLFDDIQQLFGGTQLDLPVNFEGTTVNYTTTDFGGNVSALVTDPTNTNNTVVEAIKTSQAATWAGTTIGTPGGFASNIPLSLTDSKMSVRVWSPVAGTPIRLKVEDSSDPTHTCETETVTTVNEGWEIMEFNFVNQAPGTESLAVGLSMGWTYNMASIFFNFGTDGATAGEETYYFDDVYFGEFVLSTKDSKKPSEDFLVFPNPAIDAWNITNKEVEMEHLSLFNDKGHLIGAYTPVANAVSIDASLLAPGIYLAKLSSNKGMSVVRLLKI